MGTLHPTLLPQCLGPSLLALQATRHIKTLIKALETREPQNPSLHLKKILVVSRLVSLSPRFCLGLSVGLLRYPLLPTSDPNNFSPPPPGFDAPSLPTLPLLSLRDRLGDRWGSLSPWRVGVTLTGEKRGES